MNGNLNIGTINGLTIDQILDKMASKGIGIYNPNGIFIQDYSDIIDGEIALGSVVKMGDYDWLVCHFDPTGKVFYMACNNVVSNTAFSSSGAEQYNGSTLASVAKTFENNLGSTITNRLLTWNVIGVTQKVHVAPREQLNGGFEWFNNDSNRICNDTSGSPAKYWTSSPISTNSITCVTSEGGFGNSRPQDICGFRPFVALSF